MYFKRDAARANLYLSTRTETINWLWTLFYHHTHAHTHTYRARGDGLDAFHRRTPAPTGSLNDGADRADLQRCAFPIKAACSHTRPDRNTAVMEQTETSR